MPRRSDWLGRTRLASGVVLYAYVASHLVNHALGPVIIGDMGYHDTHSVTAIGDAVNTASRLESMTKEFGCQAVVSSVVARRAGVDLAALPSREVRVRGRDEPLLVYLATRADALPAAGAAAQPAAQPVS